MEKVKDLRYKRTLYVGLGGAGIETLSILKKNIIENNNGSLPEQVKFLLIDTNSTDLSNKRDFDACDKVCISVREPYQRYMHDLRCDKKTHEFIPPKNKNSLLALDRGAGQIRSNGHFAVIEHQYSNQLLQLFRNAGDELMSIDIDADTLERDSKIEVRMVFSIAGGTGSGTFLPISMIIRKAIKNSELTAYIYSATTYSKIVEKSAKYSVMQNAYAALCELDYMMDFGVNHKQHPDITFNFGPEPTQQIKQENRPFDEVYYIDKYTSLHTADTIEFSYNDKGRLQENTAKVMEIAATNIITAHTGAVDNVRQKIFDHQFDVSDRFAWVNGVGYAELKTRRIDSTDSEVIALCEKALYERLNENTLLDDFAVNNIVDKIVAPFNESGPNEADGDPVLNKIYDNKNGKIKDEIKEKRKGKISATSNPDESGISLDWLTGKDKEKHKEEFRDEFQKALNKLIKDLIDTGKYENQEYKNQSGTVIESYSLYDIKQILDKIDSFFINCINVLKNEKEEEYSPKKQEELQENLRNAFNKANSKEGLPANDFLADPDAELIAFKVLKQRHERAIEVLEACKKYLEEEAQKDLNRWIQYLNYAKSFIKSELKGKNKSKRVQERHNVVELYPIPEKFQLSYEDIEAFSREENKGMTEDQKPQNAYMKISGKITSNSGDIQSVLSMGLHDIENIKRDNEGNVKIERTRIQKQIERLIDLSSPTMQVDRHGYGEQVKVDSFWYVMTDASEANRRRVNGDAEAHQKSGGKLLQTFIEQNTLDARVNLVHVPGWKDFAVIYRVDGAVPPYFVDGVSMGTTGGFTLEGCYDELQKTTCTYTPFSHETLRKLLEYKPSVLKPMDVIEMADALDMWVNFIMLGFIEVRDGSTYCVDSKLYGERISDNLLCRKKVVVLGETRSEAFYMFQRYAGALLGEVKKEYDERCKNFKWAGKTVHINEIRECDYIEDFNLSQYSLERMKELLPDNPDFDILDKEINHIEKRYKEYLEQKRLKRHKNIIASCDTQSAFEKYCRKETESTETEK